MNESRIYSGISTNEFAYKAHSPNRFRGANIEHPADKYIYWLPFMIESGMLQNNDVCLSVSHLIYDVASDSLNYFLGDNYSVLYSITECPFQKVVIPLGIWTGSLTESPTGHANMLFVDKSKTPWEIERFEPHGHNADDDWVQDIHRKIDNAINYWLFTKLGKKRFTYLRPVDVCPMPGPQIMGGERNQPFNGFCQMWVLLYAEMRLAYPSASPDQLVEWFINLPQEELYEMVQDYIHFVRDTPIPQSFKDLQDAKLEMIQVYEIGLKNFRTSQVDDVEAISYQLYTLMANAPKSVETVKIITEIIVGLFSKLTYSVLPDWETYVVPILENITGKDLRNQKHLGDKMSKLVNSRTRDSAKESIATKLLEEFSLSKTNGP